MNYIVSAVTDIGRVKKTNQDSYSVRIINTGNGRIVFAVLCDGMGGLSRGEVASGTLVHAFCKWVDGSLPKMLKDGFADADIQNEWLKLTNVYNEKIKMYGKQYGIDVGTTVTAMLIIDNKYYIVNVGDTRAYEISDDVYVLTKDHTLVAQEVEQGTITLEEAETDSRRSVLTQCVGASDSVYPDVFFGQTKQNVVYFLCSDGFRHTISEKEIFNHLNANVMLDETSMEQNIKTLIELNKQRLERDNITVVAIRTF